MVLFFDRDVGVIVPYALQILKLPIPVEYHQSHFAQDTPDDEWMSEVGRRQWTIIGHDSQHHVMASELSAVKQYQLGCFYLWGAEASRWQKMQCFARAYDRIVRAMNTTARPFIYRVTRIGLLHNIQVP